MIIIGDSHALMFTDHGIHCGPHTAYRLFKNHDKIVPMFEHLRNIPVKMGAIFGEIDCRIHIWYQSKKKDLNIFNTIHNTVCFYVEYLNFLRKEGFDIHFILEIVPAAEEENIYQYEYYADFFNRQLITHNFNHKLSVAAKNNGYHFVKYSDLVTESNYLVKREYLMDDKVHLKPIVKDMIVERIDKILDITHPNREVLNAGKRGEKHHTSFRQLSN